jgi:hypothetical protein
MLLDSTAHLALSLLDLAHCGVEGLPDRDPQVLALGGVAAPPVDHHVLMPRHGDAKPNVKQIPVLVTGLRSVDDHMTTRDARTEFFEALRLRSDLGSDLFRRLALPEGDVDWRLHLSLTRRTSFPSDDKVAVANRLLIIQVPLAVILRGINRRGQTRRIPWRDAPRAADPRNAPQSQST